MGTVIAEALSGAMVGQIAGSQSFQKRLGGYPPQPNVDYSRHFTQGQDRGGYCIIYSVYTTLRWFGLAPIPYTYSVIDNCRLFRGGRI